MTTSTPWHNPGKWLANPAYWDEEALAERADMPRSIRFIDSTLSEGDDCVGHQLNFNTRLGLMERLSAIGIGEITLPSHTRFDEEADLVKAYRRLGLKTRLVSKGPGITPPLKGDWRGIIHHHLDLGAEVISPICRWPHEHTLSDFSGDMTKEAMVEAIGESVAYMKSQGVRVVPWIGDSMRLRSATVCTFAKAIADAGADGVYLVDSRGNSHPLASKILVKKVRAVVGDCEVYVQHHNDLGVATANALTSAMAGATWIDCSAAGVGDRGGCVALEEAAVLFEMYGVETGIRLAGLYEVGIYTQKAFGAALAPWKPILGENWNKEEGHGHMAGGDSSDASIGVAPDVVGRTFEGVIGVKLLFGRERSSAWNDDPKFLRELIEEWGLYAEEPQFQTILHRARAAVTTAHDRHYITLEEFRSICDGVLGTW